MAQAASAPQGRLGVIARGLSIVLTVAIIAAGIALKDQWLPHLRAWLSPLPVEGSTMIMTTMLVTTTPRMPKPIRLS